MLIPALVLAVQAAAAPAAPLPHITFERHVLPNGLTVLLREDHSVPIAAVNIWYKVGSKNEQAGKTGFAHLFEHYMFKGSAHIPEGGYTAAISRIGGEFNASTNNDRTNYYAVVPSESYEEVLRIESDRLGFLNINQANLDNQRDVVKEEKTQRANRAYAQSGEAMNDLVWDQGYPYKWPVIGFVQDLDGAALKDVKGFHDVYYLPNNAVLVINGDIDPKAALAKVAKWFGDLPAGPTPPALNAPAQPPLQQERRRVVVDPQAQFPQLLLAYRIPAQGQPGWHEAVAAAMVLGGGESSRLVEKLRNERRLVLSIGAFTDDGHEGSLLMIKAIPAPGVEMAAVQKAIEDELEAFAEEGPSERELNRVKAGWRTGTLDALQHAQKMAESMAEGEALSHDPAAVITDLRAMTQMGVEAPKAAARRYLQAAKPAVVVTEPAQ